MMGRGTIGDRRQNGFNGSFLTRVFLAWLLVAAVLFMTSIGQIAGYRFPDGDDMLRLVQVRDWLAGQGWYDVTQYRIDPPAGVEMHWSRIVDIPLAAVIVLFRPILGTSGAEMAALILVPLLTSFALLIAIGRIAWRLFDEEVTGLACLVAAMAVPLVYQLRPMRIDHHGWQIVMALVAVNALMARDARKGGWLAGGIMALWLSISLEGLPMVAAILGIGFWRWLRNWDDRLWLVSMMQALAGGSVALFALTRGIAFVQGPCDIVGPGYIAAMVVGAVGITGVGAMARRPALFTVGALGLVAMLALFAAWQIAPQCRGGAFAAIDGVTRSFWLDNVAEGLPVWRQTPGTALQILLPPILAIYISFGLAARSGDWLHRWHLEYAVLLIAALAISVMVARAGALASALSAVPLGYQLRQWLRTIRNLHQPGKQAAAAAGIVAALLPAMPLSLMMWAAPGKAEASDGVAIMSAECRIEDGLAQVNTGPADIFAPIDLGPRLLLQTPHRVVSTPHHRAHAAIGETIRTFTGSVGDAREMTRRRGIEFVALCPDLSEVLMYRDAAPDGFAAVLSTGNAPDWLVPVDHAAGDEVRIWRVLP